MLCSFLTSSSGNTSYAFLYPFLYGRICQLELVDNGLLKYPCRIVRDRVEEEILRVPPRLLCREGEYYLAFSAFSDCDVVEIERAVYHARGPADKPVLVTIHEPYLYFRDLKRFCFHVCCLLSLADMTSLL